MPEDSIGISSEEKAALVRLYSQYEYKKLRFTNELVESEMISVLNGFGKLGWHMATSDWDDEGVIVVLERQTFSMKAALEMMRNVA